MTEKLRTTQLVFLLLCNTLGTGIFFIPGLVLKNAITIQYALMAWIFSGVVAILFGLCYAELGSTYPQEGGDAVYLSKAYGNTASVIYSIISVFVVLPCGGALMTQNICKSLKCNEGYQMAIMIGLLIGLAVLNYFGNKYIFRVQYILTVLKMLVVFIFILLACLVFFTAVKVKGTKECAIHECIREMKDGAVDGSKDVSGSKQLIGFVAAIFTTLWSYDGWNSGNFIAHTIDRPARTLPLAMTISTLIVTIIYLFINLSYFYVLPYSSIVEGDLINDYFDNLIIYEWLQKIMPYLVNIIPPLGTLNGSFLVATCITDSFINKLENKNLYRIGSLAAFGILVFLYSLIKNPVDIIKKIGFCVYLFYGASILAILILRRKEKNQTRGFVVNSGLVVGCVAFSVMVVIYAIASNFIAGK